MTRLKERHRHRWRDLTGTAVGCPSHHCRLLATLLDVATHELLGIGVENLVDLIEEIIEFGLELLSTLSGGSLLFDLDLRSAGEGIVPGAEVLVLCKATSISIALPSQKEEQMKLSFPNQLRGKVVNLITSSTLVLVYIDTPAGQVVSAIIPSAAEQIDLKVGDEVTALFKALDVSLAKN